MISPTTPNIGLWISLNINQHYYLLETPKRHCKCNHTRVGVMSNIMCWPCNVHSTAHVKWNTIFRTQLCPPHINANSSTKVNAITSVRRGEATVPWPPPQTLKIKNVNTVLSKTCFQNAQKCVFLGVILQNFPGGMTPDPHRMVVPSTLPLKLICDVTRLWRNLASPSEIFCARHCLQKLASLQRGIGCKALDNDGSASLSGQLTYICIPPSSKFPSDPCSMC